MRTDGRAWSRLAGQQVPISRAELVEYARALFLALSDSATTIAALPAGPTRHRHASIGAVASDMTGDAFAKASDDGPEVAFVEVALVRPLRGEVLRPGRPAESSAMHDDDHPLTRHAAVTVDGVAVAVGSILPEAPPWAIDLGASWRLRGMATRDGMRSGGLGSAVLTALLEHARSEGGRLVWCAARIRAQPFYERFGFAPRGERFMTEGVEHVHMWRDLGESAS
jgi:GNAT superfamily N-acetyltransferase